MKFGEKLEAYAVPEWADCYLKYKALKKFLKRRKQQVNSSSFSSSSVRLLGGLFTHYPLSSSSVQDNQTNKIKQKTHSPSATVPPPPPPTPPNEVETKREKEDIQQEKGKEEKEKEGTNLLSVPLLNPLLEADNEFLEKLDEEIAKIEKHFSYESKLIEEHLHGVEAELTDIESKGVPKTDRQTKAMVAHRKRLQKGVVSVWDGVDKLEGFVKMNIMALYKILKKRDKLFNMSNLFFDYQKRSSKLNALNITQTTKDKILDLYTRAGGGSPDEAENFQCLQAAVQKHLMQQMHPNYAWVSCFIGACSVLLMDILVMCFINATNSRYNVDVILAVLPIFRFVLMFVLFVWGIAAAVALMEVYGVNYKFILEVDSKCQISSSTLFTLASLQTIVWILAMGIFIADYKFLIFGPHTLYWVYPIVLLVSEFSILLLPNRTFRHKYRRDILYVILLVFKCGIVGVSEVTLVQNVVGDILTSFSKPLGDLQYTFCYFSTGLSHNEPATCPNVDYWLRPCLFGLPYYLRLMQCITRFRGETENKNRYMHLANAGKYTSGIAVVICTSIPWEQLGMSLFVSRLIWVFSYIIATLYMFLWDIYMDWGLMPDPDHFLRLNGRMMFPKFVYYFVAFTNLVGRLTWAMTLMPIDILENKKLNANLLTFFISTLEIYRRSAWAIIRLENEHLTNSSRYRAILWVPRLYLNSENVQMRGDDFALEKKKSFAAKSKS